MRLRWTRPALIQLSEIVAYIAADNPVAARRVMSFIRDQVGKLVPQPLIGRTGRIDATCELVMARYPYIVVYRVKDATVEVLAVVHTSRRWPESLPATEES